MIDAGSTSFEPTRIVEIDVEAEAHRSTIAEELSAPHLFVVRRGRHVIGSFRLPRGTTRAEVLRRIEEAAHRDAGSGRAEDDVPDEWPSVTVAICTRDRPETLVRTLASLRELDYPAYDVLVVDNASTGNATREAVEREGSVRYVYEGQPGLSHARNAALREASGSILAFTDDDAVVDRHWLTAMARAFRSMPEVACVTGITLPLELESPAQDYFEQFGGHSKGRGYTAQAFNTSTHFVQDPLFPAPAFGAGVNMAFDTEVLRRLGGFETSLGAGTPTKGGEDTYAFYRVLDAGHTLVYEPDALVWHEHRREYDVLRSQLHGYGIALTAFYAHVLARQPGKIVPLLRLGVRAVRYMFGGGSERTSRMRSDYPKELDAVQRRGLLSGPLAYVRSRLRQRALARS